MPNPDEQLVYLHCSSIFTGADAEVRKLKNVTKVLLRHNLSIEGLTDKFPLNRIATVAKKLLGEGVFQSRPKASRRFPELFRQPEAEEAKSKASKANTIKIEAEQAHEAVSTSAETDSDYDEAPAYLRRPPSNDSGCGASSVNANLHSQPITTANLHSFYLPFKIQHKILTIVQTILEECCFNFGNIWVPHLMEAQRWHEVESIELTQWVKIFCKRTENLPTSATRSVPGKSLKQVLNDTNSLRHAAVHRLPTTAAEIVSMLRAAHLFTTILNDPLRTSEIERIRIKASLAISYYSADGPRCNSGLSSYGDQTDHLERQMSAQNHEESAAGFSKAKYGILHKDRLNLFPMAEDKDENELDVKPHPQTTDTYHSPNASGPGVEEDSEASDWLSFLSGTPISEEADKETVAHIAKVSNAGDTSAGHVAVPATALASQPAMSAQTSSIPYSISSADVKAPQVETHISMPDQGILMDTDMLAPIMSVVSSTGTAILNHARAAYEWCVAEDAEYQ